MSGTYRVRLKERASGDFVDALLLDSIDVAYVQRADNAWLTYLAIAKAKATTSGSAIGRIEHAHWSWEAKVKATKHLLSYVTMAVEKDGEIQGLMMILTDGKFSRLTAKPVKPLVYVEYLATAPWNMSLVDQSPKFAGIGTVLMRAAVEASLDLGFNGRIGLHSLPQAEPFYDRLNMHCVEIDRQKQYMKYYEMTPEQAAQFCS